MLVDFALIDHTLHALVVAQSDFWVGGQARNQLFHIGALSPVVVRALQRRQIEIKTAAISVRDVELLRARRDEKLSASTADGQPKALPMEDLLRLPAIVAKPRAVLLDPVKQLLFYVFNPVQRSAGKVVR